MQHDDPRIQRLVWDRLDVADCWLFLGPLNHNGYGVTRVGGKFYRVHRLVWELLIGPIPKGLQLDHRCRVPACCNPTHIEIVTQRVNILRGRAPSALSANKTHCKHGHPLSGDNVYWFGTWRQCRECRRRNIAERRRERRNAA